MVMVTDVLVPLRFLALLGHFFASILAMYGVVRVCTEKKTSAPLLLLDPCY